MEHMKKRAAELEALQRKPEQIRNICVLAHVDHGKTTLSDSLISYNNIISHKQAGQIRFLDNREDEQERLITMKASSISIIYRPTTEPSNYLVNLIDSPGHVDFSFEVSSALRLSDGALVLVDALESVCQQTVTVIRQAWEERVKMCLVINKIDRLPSQLSMNPVDGYNHIKGILQRVNAEISALISMQINVMIANDPSVAKMKEELVSKMEEEYYFSPEKGNVAFASALDCWAFTLDSYAEMIAPKVGIDKSLLRQHLWGDYYYSPSQKKFLPLDSDPASSRKAAFVVFALDPIWKEYGKLDSLKDFKDAVPYKETQGKIKDKLSKQMPLERSVLAMVVRHLPSPKTAQKFRLPMLCPALFTEEAAKSPEVAKLKAAIENVDSSEDSPVAIYVSKMMAIDRVQISDLKDDYLGEADHSSPGNRLALIAFARIFSGCLKKGKSVYVMGPKHNKAKGVTDIHGVTINHIYTFMGMHLDVSDILLAGNVGGIGGLDLFLYKVGTISTSPECPTFTALSNKSKPIVKVAIEAERLSDMENLAEGLKKLNKAEPSVEMYLTESGEYILCACGEVHLQKCLKDLKDEYAKVNFKVSEHIVNFRETILLRHVKPDKPTVQKGQYPEPPPEPSPIPINPIHMLPEVEKQKFEEEEKKAADKVTDKTALYLEKIRHLKDIKRRGLAFDVTPNGRCRIYMRAFGLDFTVTKWLDVRRPLLKKIASKQVDLVQLSEFVKQFKEEMLARSTPKKIINLILSYLLCFGPKNCGPNMVISPFLKTEESLLYVPSEGSPVSGKYHRCLPEVLLKFITSEEMHKSILSGFQLATLSGPLCEEQMFGACFLIEAIEYIEMNLEVDAYGPLAGQVMSTTRELCRRTFMNADPRLVEGLYMCTMQVSSGTLGKIYSVIHKRRGRVVSEELLPETDMFTVRVLIPVVESFGFAEEIRAKGEGITDPQMTFSHWEIINADPFFVPKTMAQMEEFGQQAQAPNLAKILIEKVRKRKGLPTEGKLVVNPDKQRTLTKMK